MKILFLSFYYPPDLSAGSFRAVSLVRALEAAVPDNLKLKLVTTQPNRYADIAVQVSDFENVGALRLQRISIPGHKSGVLAQARAFLTYALEVNKIAKEGEWDLVVATSSRLMTAYLACLVARKRSIPIYLDIRDLFVDTIKEVLNPYVLFFIMPILRLVEKYTFRSASKINIVSEGFRAHIRNIASEVDISAYTNGVDADFIFKTSENSVAKDTKRRSKVVLYAGNIGDGQGLHEVLPDAARALGDLIEFKVVGGGGRLQELRDASVQLDANSDKIHKPSEINIFPPVARDKLLDEYKAADILFVHLNDYKAFKKVLPSKLFEYAATGKPIVAGVSGYAADFVRSEIPGAIVFEPCDSLGLVNAIREAEMQPVFVNRAQFCEKYARATIMKHLVQDILTVQKIL